MDYLKKYYQTTATHNYILGAVTGGKIRVYFITLDLNGYRTIFNEKPTQAKRQMVIKYRSTKAKLKYLESHATKKVDLMGTSDLEKLKRQKVNKYGKPYTENCGECFEWQIAQRFGGVQNKYTALKHTDGGDLVIDGVAWQVKYEKGAIMVEG